MYANASSRRLAGRLSPIGWSIERTPLGDTSLHFHVRPVALFALILALLLHALAIYLVMRPKEEREQPQGASEPISARLITPEAPRARAEAPPPAAQPAPTPPRPRVKSKDRSRREVQRTPKVAQQQILSTPDPAPVAPPKRTTEAPVDMMSYVNQQRERRRAAEEAEGRVSAEAVARERGPSADEIAAERIKQNLKQPGASGVFQITRKGVRTAAFVFRGWTTDAANARREFIEVDAGVNGDIERAVVRRMIELIRRYYSGDFNWESRRLGRTKVLSAAPEHNAELEEFLIQEFFRVGANYPP